MALSFDIHRSQCAMLCEVDLEEKLTLAAALRNSNRSRYDGDPVVFPTVPEAPPEIPGFVLQSRDGTKTLSVSAVRVDVNDDHEARAFSSICALIKEEGEFLKGLAQTLSSSDQVKSGITRVGVVFTLSANLDDAELENIRARFLPSNPGLGENRSELGFLDRLQWQEISVNRWLRLTMARREDRTGSLEVILDFNTVPQVGLIMDDAKIAGFLENLKSQADEEMKVFHD